MDAEMRDGAELNRATKPFVIEDRARTWRLLLVTLGVIAALHTTTLLAPWWPVKLASSALVGLVYVRLFIFFHDFMHGAIGRDSRAMSVIMSGVGFLIMAVKSVWKETHNYHHKHNSKLIGSSIGSYPLLTAGMYRRLPKSKRVAYRIARHPLTIGLGYVPVFMIGMTLSPFFRDKARHWGGPLALALHLTVAGLAIHTLGWVTGSLLTVLPVALSTGVGAYLFYAQHNFPAMKLRGRRDWDYTYAALHSSSMFDMSPVGHWLTGNIGYHHVHHLNHRIPFYRLPEAMAAIPELQNPGRTTWHPRDVWGCLTLALWDPEQERMMSYSEALAS
ncbi:MAG: fatty acid desaturase [Myxococcota bacterium]|nr:fatty acid desaturase [Myxococcota bacterium]